MATITDPRKLKQGDLEVTPRTLSSVPAGSDGQLVPITDNPGVNLMVRKGGALVPAVVASAPVLGAVQKTVSDITMTVNYSTGTSPPSGTIVTSQTEYDALGYVLKYPQDALDILPAFVDNAITVNCVAGNHYAKPGTGGAFGTAMLDLPAKFTSVAKASGVWPYATAAINFVGVVDTVEAGIAGTNGSYTFTRTTGTWVVNAMKGKRVLIVSGAGAGSYSMIVSNTTTMLNLASVISVGGSVIDIQDASTVFLPNDGTSDTANGIQSAYIGSSGLVNMVDIMFNSIQIGSTAKRLPMSFLQTGNFSFWTCFFFVGSGMQIMQSSFVQGVYLFDCYVNSAFTGWGYIFGVVYGGLVLQDVFVEGHAADAFVGTFDGSLGGISVYEAVFAPDSNQTAAILYISDGVDLRPVGRFLVQGNTIADGLYVSAEILKPAVTREYFMQINNCNVAVRVFNLDSLKIAFGFGSGSGNAVGWKIEGGCKMQVAYPSNIGATVDMQIDGQNYSYSLLPNVGDEIIGQYGSSMLRTA